MPIPDKVAAAHRINDLLKGLLSTGAFRLKYRITVDPQLPEDRDWEKPEILVEFSGPDGSLLLERGAELMRSFEHLAQEMLRLGSDEHDKVVFDCQNYRKTRLEELRAAAQVAAERVRKTGAPYLFNPMTSRERRMVHLALRDESDLKTESAGEAGGRCVVVYPKDYQGKPVEPRAPSFSRRR
jgi:spoIIIJ-associated protein